MEWIQLKKESEVTWNGKVASIRPTTLSTTTKYPRQNINSSYSRAMLGDQRKVGLKVWIFGRKERHWSVYTFLKFFV